MKWILVTLLYIVMVGAIHARSLHADMFEMKSGEAVKNIVMMFGEPVKNTDDMLIYHKLRYEGVMWDEAYFKFSGDKLTEARFYSRQQGKTQALRKVTELADILKQEHPVTKDYEDKHTYFYMGGMSPLEYGHLFTIFISPYKGGWSTQLRYGPF